MCVSYAYVVIMQNSTQLNLDTLGLFKCIVSDLFFYNNQKSATSLFVILPLQF